MRARSRSVARSPSLSTGTITRAPAPRNAVTTAAPRPPAPPVMMATLPSSVLVTVSSCERAAAGRRSPIIARGALYPAAPRSFTLARRGEPGRQEEPVKITDVTLTLFAWPDIPARSTDGTPAGSAARASSASCGSSRTRPGGPRVPGLGHAQRRLRRRLPHPLPQAHGDRTGSARSRAAVAGPVARGAATRPCGPSARWTSRCGTSAGKAASLPIHKLLGSYRESAPAYASSAVLGLEGRLRGRGGALQVAGLDGVQDPSPHGSGGRHRGVPRRAPGRGRRASRSCSTRRGPTSIRRRCAWGRWPRSWASTGTRIRWPTTTSTTT